MRQINNHAGEKTRFSESKQKTRDVKLKRRLHERSERRRESPYNHNSANKPSGAPFFHQQRAGNFQQKIPPKEKPGPKADNSVVESRQVASHGQFGNRNIDAIDIGDDVTEKKQRQ